jgi:hypothetical protein
MKVKQLRNLIRETIQQIKESDTQGAVHVKPGDLAKIKVYSKQGIDTVEDPSVKEGELDEMANTPKGYTLSDENMDVSKYANQKLRGVSLSDILTFIKENPGTAEKEIATQFGFERQQPINALMKGLRDTNIVTRLDKAGQPEVPKAPGEEGDEEEVVTGPEALFVGSGNSLAQYFDNEPNVDGSEDITPEEPGIEKSTYTKPTTSRSKAADFLLDNDRLIQKIINAQAASKLRVKEAAGDEGGLSSADVTAAEKKRKETAVSNLPALISQLVDRIQAEDKDVQDAIIDMLGTKFASVGYTSLTKKIAQAIGTNIPQPSMPAEEPGIEDDEEEIESLDEYAIRKLQFYAGIIK